jgi:hypothetical protein
MPSPIQTFDCQIRFYDEHEESYWDVSIAMQDVEEDDPEDPHIFFAVPGKTESEIREMYSKANSNEEWYIL